MGRTDVRGRNGLSPTGAVLVCAAEAMALLIGFGVMCVGLRTTGLVFSEGLVTTRHLTWTAMSLLVLIGSIGSLAYAWAYARSRGSYLLVAAQILVTAAVIVAVVRLHGAIPVPPGGIRNPGIGP
jgi:hypothetical protein